MFNDPAGSWDVRRARQGQRAGIIAGQLTITVIGAGDVSSTGALMRPVDNRRGHWVFVFFLE